MRSSTLRERRVEVSTSLGTTSEAAGSSSTSSKVRPSAANLAGERRWYPAGTIGLGGMRAGAGRRRGVHRWRHGAFRGRPSTTRAECACQCLDEPGLAGWVGTSVRASAGGIELILTGRSGRTRGRPSPGSATQITCRLSQGMAWDPGSAARPSLGRSPKPSRTPNGAVGARSRRGRRVGEPAAARSVSRRGR